jgi:uncharacterized protein YdbL (DUF1318 family)
MEEPSMRQVMRVTTIALIGLMVGCVVIPNTFDANINVTIRHVEQQADDFLNYVEGKSDTLEDLSDQTSMLQKAWIFVSPIQAAYAAETNLNSPRVKQIGAKMKQRYPEVVAIKKTGAVGETNRGLLELVKPNLITDGDEKNKVQRVIAAENEDRKALYKEIARLNEDQNMAVGQVEQVYALERLERAKSGELVQMPNAGSTFDKVKGSAVGQKLGAQCVAGAWVTMP